MVSMATQNIIFKNWDVLTKILVSQQQHILEYLTWYQKNSVVVEHFSDCPICKLSNLYIHEYL